MADTIGIGLIGAGGNTRSKHIPGLLGISGVQLRAVANRSIDSSQRVATEFQIPGVYDDWRSVVDDPSVDAVVIGTWPDLHCEATVAALESEKHVLCEARAAMDAAEARRMQIAADGHTGLVLQIVPSPLTLRVDATIREALGSGELGDLYALEVYGAMGTFVDPDAPAHWRQQRRYSGLNVLNMGIWYEATARWLGHATEVMAQSRICVPVRDDFEYPDREVQVDVPDLVQVMAKLPADVMASYSFSRVNGMGPHPGAWIFGSEGTLRFEARDKSLWRAARGDEALRPVDIPEEKVGRWQVEQDFVGAIRGENDIELTTIDAAVRYMEFTEAVHMSARTRAAIALPLSAPSSSA